MPKIYLSEIAPRRKTSENFQDIDKNWQQNFLTACNMRLSYTFTFLSIIKLVLEKIINYKK